MGEEAQKLRKREKKTARNKGRGSKPAILTRKRKGRAVMGPVENHKRFVGGGKKKTR